LLILGIETATRAGSVALVRTDASGEPQILAESSFGESGASAAEILPAFEDGLARSGLPESAIDAIAVSMGPGSFTGLRVGLATAQGLALGIGGALIGVPTLDALARTALEADESMRPGDLVCTCLDARRGEVYAALHLVTSVQDASFARLGDDAALAPDALREWIEETVATQSVGAIRFVGEGAERYGVEIVDAVRRCTSSVALVRARPRAATVAVVGEALLRTRGPDEPAAMVPRYARASEAETKRQQALARAEEGA
jgi:tRNA threonylcarbamoyladenosine biosynthesis protein TsaB